MITQPTAATAIYSVFVVERRQTSHVVCLLLGICHPRSLTQQHVLHIVVFLQTALQALVRDLSASPDRGLPPRPGLWKTYSTRCRSCPCFLVPVSQIHLSLHPSQYCFIGISTLNTQEWRDSLRLGSMFFLFFLFSYMSNFQRGRVSSHLLQNVSVVISPNRHNHRLGL